MERISLPSSMRLPKNRIFKNAIIISGVGMLKGAKIGYYRGGTYQIKTISDPARACIDQW